MKDLTREVKLIDRAFLEHHSIEGEELLKVIIKHLTDLSLYYPEFVKWLSFKVLPGLYEGERKILLRHYKDDLAGIAIVKDTELEKKLCCLRVLPKYQGTGIGLKLFEDSFYTLGTDRPLLSIAEEQTHNFLRIFNHYGFELGEIYQDYYRPKKLELSFNGLIENPSTATNENHKIEIALPRPINNS